MKIVRVHVSGRVQGVWFRGWTCQQANKLGVDGRVRNLADGRVEAVVAGAAPDVDRLLSLLWEGPPHARVDDVTVEACDDVPAKGFRQVR